MALRKYRERWLIFRWGEGTTWIHIEMANIKLTGERGPLVTLVNAFLLVIFIIYLCINLKV